MLDCDVLQADGGTRTAAITGAYVALADAVATGKASKAIKASATVLTGSVAAVSVGVVAGAPVLDLDYVEDVDADTDMNVVMTGDGRFVEVQGDVYKRQSQLGSLKEALIASYGDEGDFEEQQKELHRQRRFTTPVKDGTGMWVGRYAMTGFGGQGPDHHHHRPRHPRHTRRRRVHPEPRHHLHRLRQPLDRHRLLRRAGGRRDAEQRVG